MELQRFQLTLILLLTRVELTLEQQPQVKEALVHTEVIAGLLVGLGLIIMLVLKRRDSLRHKRKRLRGVSLLFPTTHPPNFSSSKPK